MEYILFNISRSYSLKPPLITMEIQYSLITMNYLLQNVYVLC